MRYTSSAPPPQGTGLWWQGLWEGRLYYKILSFDDKKSIEITVAHIFAVVYFLIGYIGILHNEASDVILRISFE